MILTKNVGVLEIVNLILKAPWSRPFSAYSPKRGGAADQQQKLARQSSIQLEQYSVKAKTLAGTAYLRASFSSALIESCISSTQQQDCCLCCFGGIGGSQ